MSARRKGPHTYEFRAPDAASAKRYLLSGIPAGFWIAVRARAKRDGVSVRSLILTLLRQHLQEGETPSHGNE